MIGVLGGLIFCNMVFKLKASSKEMVILLGYSQKLEIFNRK
jgi:hypothetical protein